MKHRGLLALVAGALLCSTSFASAADKAVQYQPKTKAYTDLFSGWNVGVNIGYGFGKLDTSILDFDSDGWAFGGRLGVRSQVTGGFYLGLETEYNWSDFSDSKNPFGPINVKTKLTDYGVTSITAGYTFLPALLAYGSVGVAYGNGEARISAPGGSASADANHLGWSIGAGVEYSLADWQLPNTSIGVDYKHIMFGKADYGFKIGAPINISVPGKVTEDVVMFRLTQRFAPL